MLSFDLRPQNFDDFIGQNHLAGSSGVIRRLVNGGIIPSMIFWGPPGCGKTSLAEVIANSTEAEFVRISAVMDGKDKLKVILDQASQVKKSNNKKTIVFIDEIHRWNKAQQDALLPYVEQGDIILIGATTENPSFEIISALLSRARVFVFEPHSVENIFQALQKGYHYLHSSINTKNNIKLENIKTEISPTTTKAFQLLAEIANGDMRFALNALESAYSILQEGQELDFNVVQDSIQKVLLYDKNGEEHYNIISAIHKSLRSSNPSAGAYWVMRMLEAGEDPLYIARRLVRFASEDIGNASPTALLLANSVYDTCHKLGLPECSTALIQLVEYLALAPKNNSAYRAVNSIKEDIKKFGNLPVPMHLRNAPTKLMKNIGYGKNYQYDHDLPNKKSSQICFPDELVDRDYFK